ncbi:type II toxin-antitoxin system RelE/ParE family toxin [Pseudoduganella namucuonensis]|uniref:type II toxin-antitoxin system RelE/ParE family toxin n=1 Tax=Pseudoduganella namucuonensis TaxID=1035707 RepID=UPI000B8A5F3D|nr:type II toxin-antitoxin system RelE/ParE family toxin [Pseudoduganella namucuonensis]
MIKSFRHKGLQAFFETGSTKGILPAHAKRLARMLLFIARARAPDELDIPGWRLHPLHGRLQGWWSLTVTGNWRLIFRFSGTDVEMLDYLDYH